MPHCLYCGKPTSLLQQFKLGRGRGRFCSSEHLTAYTELQTKALNRLMVGGIEAEADEALKADTSLAIESPVTSTGSEPHPPAAGPSVEVAGPPSHALQEHIAAEPALITIHEPHFAFPVMTAASEAPDLRKITAVEAPPIVFVASDLGAPASEQEWAGCPVPLERMKPRSSARRHFPELTPRLTQIRPLKPSLEPGTARFDSPEYVVPAIARPRLATLAPHSRRETIFETIPVRRSPSYPAAPQPAEAALAFEPAVSRGSSANGYGTGLLSVDPPPPDGRFVVRPGGQPFEFFDAVSDVSLPKVQAAQQTLALNLANTADREHWALPAILAPRQIAWDEIPAAVAGSPALPAGLAETTSLSLAMEGVTTIEAPQAVRWQDGIWPSSQSNWADPPAAIRFPSTMASPEVADFGYGSSVAIETAPADGAKAPWKIAANEEVPLIPSASYPSGPSTIDPTLAYLLEDAPVAEQEFPRFILKPLVGPPLGAVSSDRAPAHAATLLALKRGAGAGQSPQASSRIPHLRSIPIAPWSASSEPVLSLAPLPLIRFTAGHENPAVKLKQVAAW